MTDVALYPLRFSPIYQYRLWGGRRLAEWLNAPMPRGRIGEAWLLSDRDDFPSRVANGPLAGWTIAQLIERGPTSLLGKLAARGRRFPLLLKFLDVRRMLSVQVHPPDDRADLIPAGETGKTEAWVVLEAKPQSRVYAGLRPGTGLAELKTLSQPVVDARLASFAPAEGQGILIEAGTVHSLGDGVVVFEVQENSDVTFRLYDWDHVDPRTGQGRPLQVEQALACVNLAQGAIAPVAPVREMAQTGAKERLLACPHFHLWRLRSEDAFTIGAESEMRVLVCIDGAGDVAHGGGDVAMAKGDVVLIPAVLGVCRIRPINLITLLEIAVPEEA